jgi:hypothetical protein
VAVILGVMVILGHILAGILGRILAGIFGIHVSEFS